MKVLLLAGGDSSEREVSLTSGKAVMETLKRLGHTVYAIDPASGMSLVDGDGNLVDSLLDQTTTGPSHAAGRIALANALESPDYRDMDIVFIALHGGSGENGSIQNLLELAAMKYTGSDMTASAVAMNKAISKRLFASADILTPDWELYGIPGRQIDEQTLEHIVGHFAFPLIVKPNDSGSTIGLTKVNNPEELPAAFARARAESPGVLVEQHIPGRELTVAVLDGRPLPVVEIRPESGLYDYEAKYTKGKSEYIVPAAIPAGTSEELREAAGTAFDIIGASGLARVDFILGEDGWSYCLELNTLPGMTSLSLAPMAAEAEGIGFEQLTALIMESGLRRPVRK